MDLITSYGTMVLSPFSDDRFAWDLIFIIDPIFSGILFISLIMSILWKSSAMRICQISLFLLTIYVFFCALQHQKAKELASTYTAKHGIQVEKMASLPQPLSPFRWVILIEDQDFVYQGFVDFIKRNREIGTKGTSLLDRLHGQYRPPEKVLLRAWEKTIDLPWVDKAMDEKGVRFFFWFARFPVLKGVNSRNGRHRVEFFDLRFYVVEDRIPFVYAVEFDDQGRTIQRGFVN